MCVSSGKADGSRVIPTLIQRLRAKQELTRLLYLLDDYKNRDMV